MPNDAKFGLVFGVGLVIALGVVYYRKDAPQTAAIHADSDNASIQASPPPACGGQRPAAGRPVSRQDDGPQDEPAPVPDPMNPALP